MIELPYKFSQEDTTYSARPFVVRYMGMPWKQFETKEQAHEYCINANITCQQRQDAIRTGILSEPHEPT